MTTRKHSEVWLLGHTTEQIIGAKLLGRGDVLQRFFHLHKVEVKTVGDSTALMTEEVKLF